MASTPTKKNGAIVAISIVVERWLAADWGDKRCRDGALPISCSRARRMPFKSAPHGH